MSRVAAVVFDMDGVIIDSEPFWQAAETEVFRSVGVPFDQAMAEETTGLRINEVVALRYGQYPWTGPTQQEVEDAILDGVVQRVRSSGVMLPGVTEAIDLIRRSGVRLALATSSYEVLIEAVLDRMGLIDAFELTYSAQHEEFGKPHPAVYLTTARKLGVEPAQCLAIEDSLNGVRSAKAAGYRCLAVPATGADTARFVEADVVLGSLAEFSGDLLEV